MDEVAQLATLLLRGVLAPAPATATTVAYMIVLAYDHYFLGATINATLARRLTDDHVSNAVNLLTSATDVSSTARQIIGITCASFKGTSRFYAEHHSPSHTRSCNAGRSYVAHQDCSYN